MYKQAQYNLFTPDELDDLWALYPNGIIPGDHSRNHGNNPHTYAPPLTFGPLPDAEDDDTSYQLVDDRALCFEAGIDIPGDMFYLPPLEQIRSWREDPRFRTRIPTDDPARYPLSRNLRFPRDRRAQWRWGRDSMGLEDPPNFDQRHERFPVPQNHGVIEGGRQLLEVPHFVFNRDFYDYAMGMDGVVA